MTITPEMLAAYADGELSAEESAKVEAAMAANPALAEEVDAHRALRETLGTHFAPILEQPVPQHLTALLKRDAGLAKDNVVDLTQIRRAREEEKRAQAPRRALSPRWVIGGTLAASLSLALLFGSRISAPGGSGLDMKEGELVASGALDKALTTQFASSQGDAPVRILLSFKAQDGRYCRGFEQGSTAGIACRAEGNWQIVRTQSGAIDKAGGNYRQAGSGAADIMAAAQDMADGAALDARAEQSARDADWRP
jgi:hypothetical protein